LPLHTNCLTAVLTMKRVTPSPPHTITLQQGWQKGLYYLYPVQPPHRSTDDKNVTSHPTRPFQECWR
jgi:hypothetical protein